MVMDYSIRLSILLLYIVIVNTSPIQNTAKLHGYTILIRNK